MDSRTKVPHAGTRRRLAAAIGMQVLLLPGAGALALTPEEATRVGGDLMRVGNGMSGLVARFDAFRDASMTIAEAAPGAAGAVRDAVMRIGERGSPQDFATSLSLAGGCLLVLLLLSWLVRRTTARWRERCVGNSIRVRGAIGLLGLDTLQWVVFAVGAYVSVQLYFSAETHHDLLVVGILGGLVRWRVFVLFLDVVLRPATPQFRLIAMSNAAARAVRWCFASAALVGVLTIAVMPVLLRAGLAVPAGQSVVLAEGCLVAAMCALGLWRYLTSQSVPEPARRLWRWVGGLGIPLVWLAWSLAVVTLEFDVFHSLVYSLRIAMFAFAAYALLALSAQAHWWVRLLQHAVSVGAVLGILITLSELWLVDRLHLVAMATWVPLRQSLTTAGLTLLAGFIAWNFLHMWTEQRLQAASQGSPGLDDDVVAEPASRLTTILPLVRVLTGVAIVLLVGFVALSQLGANFTTLLASAGVFGLALSFGSQALVRDVVSGIFFMSDDAFRVGEYVDTGKLKGTVERVTMRSVRLRHQNGQIHTIPFGQLNAITNYSRGWQTIKFNLRLDPGTDIERARKAAKRVGLEIQQHTEFGKEILLPLKMQGVAEIVDNAVVLRFKFTVKPTNPSMVYRESLKRLRQAFADDGIAFASGLITVRSDSSPVTPSEASAAARAAQAAAEPADS